LTIYEQKRIYLKLNITKLRIAYRSSSWNAKRKVVSSIYELPANLTDDSATMNDRTKQKQMTGQMNHQTADPKANASVFLFF